MGGPGVCVGGWGGGGGACNLLWTVVKEANTPTTPATHSEPRLPGPSLQTLP